MAKMTAETIIRLCDWMMGYHGKGILDGLQIAAVTSVTAAWMLGLFLILS